MLLRNKMCADAGTVSCPCYLAEYGKCIVCSRLGGADSGADGKQSALSEKSASPAACDCQWQGVCIYNEYLQNNLCVKERQSRKCEVQKIKWFDDDLAVMRIGVPRGMAENAALPGSFVFVRPLQRESCFDFPVSVLRSDYEGSAIEIAVRAAGPKSRALLNALQIGDDCKKLGGAESQIGDGWISGESGPAYIELRGVYRNGLLGVEKLLDPAVKRVLCLTKGVGVAPAANYIRWAEGRHHIDVIANLDKINREFADYALGIDDACSGRKQDSGNCPVGINSLIYGPLPLKLSWAEEEKYDVIIISASEYYQQNIYVPEAKKVLSNNTSMCCGEGVCGACMHIDGGGAEHRMCKCACAESE